MIERHYRLLDDTPAPLAKVTRNSAGTLHI